MQTGGKRAQDVMKGLVCIALDNRDSAIGLLILLVEKNEDIQKFIDS